MLNHKTNQRMLAYIVTIDEIKSIPNYDRVEHARTSGWWVVVKKDEFQVGDKAIYLEVDSKVPSEDKRFEFLANKHYKIKTQKMCKVYSQGLLLPLTEFPECQDKELHDDVTELLGVTYSVVEDNIRKSKNGDPNAKYKSMAARHKELFKKKPIRWLMKRDWGRKLLFLFFGKKKDNPKSFPEWIHKTDETRIENAPFYLESTEPWIKTEKIDGTSSTYAIDFMNPKIKKGDFIVCSRNVRQKDEEQTCYHECGNVYWEMADKYNIEIALRGISIEFNAKRVVLQGETYGLAVQGNPYKLKERRFAAFNLIIDGIRFDSVRAKEVLDEYNIPFVPIIDTRYYLPKDMETFKLEADGESSISNVKREGFVYRSLDGTQSFKNVSREFLLRHNG